MSLAKQGDKVRVHYTGKLDDGTVFDSSEQRDPIEFTIGSRRLIPGFEEAVVGMNPGDTKSAKIPADQAYGPRREEMVAVVGRERLPEEIQPTVGQTLELHQTNGQVIPARIVEVSETSIKLDANHPLAGHNLTFELELVEIV